MNRRQFSRLVAGAAVTTLAPSSLLAEQAASRASNVSKSAAQLYERALILDCNSGVPEDDGLPLSQAALDMVRDSGINVVAWSLVGPGDDFTAAVKEIAFVHQLIEFHPPYFMHVRDPDDLARAKRDGKMGIIFFFESVDMLEGKLERIELFRQLGLRVMQFSYNLRSPFGAGVLEPDGGGLTPLGQEAVKRMNALGITIDVSHANASTTSDAMAASTRPVIMSHAGCVAVHPHPRNKTDDQLRALARKGGVIGIYDLPYLTASPAQPTLDDYMAHMEHALKVAGEEHVGVGSDVDVTPADTGPKGMAKFQKDREERRRAGVAAPEEDRLSYVVGLNTPHRIEVIADRLLKRGYPARVAEKIVGENFARVFKETWNPNIY